jgi:hypothetical protein
MKAPKCTGEVKPPSMSAECSAHCDAKAEAKVECTPAHIGISIKGGDEKLALKLKTAIEKDLPLILKVALGMGDRAKKLADNVKAVVEGAQSREDRSGRCTHDGAALTACIAACSPARSMRSSMSANVTVSVNVSASVSSSGERRLVGVRPAGVH